MATDTLKKNKNPQMQASSLSEPSVPFSFSSLNAILGHKRRAECSIYALETGLEHQPVLKHEQNLFFAPPQPEE